MTRRSAALALAIGTGLLSACLLSASALGGVSILTPPSVVLKGWARPAKLPRTTPKPIHLTLKGKIFEPGTGARPPALKTLSLQFDKSGAIFTKGLAICEPPRIGDPDIGWGPHCPEALVGNGEVEIEVEAPERPTFQTEAPMEIFNGAPRQGRPVLIYKVVADVPAPTTYITTSVIEDDHGKYGTKTTIPIPTIVGLDGSITGFRANIGKSWTYEGKRVSLLTADCQKGSLLLHDESELVDGSKQSGGVVQPCAQAPD